jgi:hypothetical protein
MNVERISMLFGWTALLVISIAVITSFYFSWKKKQISIQNFLALLPVIIVGLGLTFMHFETQGEPYIVKGSIVTLTTGGHATKYTTINSEWSKELLDTGLGQAIRAAAGNMTIRTAEELWHHLKTGETGLFIATPTDVIFDFLPNKKINP